MGRETLEPQELVETEAVERGRGLSTRVAVSAAILAVLASLSSLQAEHGTAESILAKNDAVLWQSRASDEWAYRQAKAIKLHLDTLRPAPGVDVDAQRGEIAASEERARVDEERRDDANREAAVEFARHRRFAVGTSLFQIAIVLETVAAVLQRPAVWWAGIGLGAAGVLAFVNGFVGLV